MDRKIVKGYDAGDYDVTYEYSDGTKETWTGGSRAWRNNNPGNIITSKFADRHGAIGSAGRFAVFPDAETGKEAIKSLFRTNSYKDLSLGDAMNRYAPKHENDTENYLQYIENKAMVDRITTVKDLSDDELGEIVDAIGHFEGYFKGSVE